MGQRVNELGLPIGEALPDWVPALYPYEPMMKGDYCDVVAIDSTAHAPDLFEAYQQDTKQHMWTYLTFGPFETVDMVRVWLEDMAGRKNQVCLALIDRKSGRAQGVASYLRIQPRDGVIEVGSIAYSPRLQKTRMATEAMYLMMKQAFEVYGYRRYEWKCDALNAASRAAAGRLGFSYEGLFRQAVVYRGRNRDTAWFSILDREWLFLKPAFEAWLAAGNFDSGGQQRHRLADLIANERAAGPHT